jgi:Lrp/AsnC family transcriptional regulator, leucine-responsive regulatory protein
VNTLNSNLDSTDWKILAELQEDGRLSYTELGRRVGLSSPAAQERVRKLEDAGIITGYRATVDYERLGLPIRASIRLDGNCREVDRMLEGLREMPNVIDVYKVLGDDCFRLLVAVASPEQLHSLLKSLSIYGETSTTVIIKAPIENRPITPETLSLMKEQR